MSESQFSSSGFKLAPFEKGRNAIQVEFANELVRALNQLGRLEIEIVRVGKSEVIYSDGRVVIQLNLNQAASILSEIQHPFQLYQGSTWLKWKVRAGLVIYTPSGDAVTPANVDTEITISANVLRYWFYLNLGSMSVSSAAARPSWSGNIIPIGFVDTLTHAADSRAVPTQFCTTNIFSPCPS